MYAHDTPGNCWDVECFKLLVSQNNNVCVCGCVGELVGGWERACVRAFVCTLLLLSIFLLFERFLAPCSLSC